MIIKNSLFTSESVSEGHPDKLCDRISDIILDMYLLKDPYARVACETMASHNKIMVSAEIKSDFNYKKEEIIQVVKKTISDTGYNSKWNYDPEKIEYEINLNIQSPCISKGVDNGGAGDQGIMFGYATDETKEHMPFPIIYAHKILIRYAELMKNGVLKNVGPDAKSQITVFYDKNGFPKKIISVVLSVQHNKKVMKGKNISDEFKRELIEKAIKPVLGEYMNNLKYENIFINPAGSFLIGGPAADTGVTGRKIIADTYGGMSPHGGGAFSGKDPTKVDRSAAYMARFVAKNLVREGLCKKCLIQVSYAIGVERPVSIMVNSFGTSKTGDEKLLKIINEKFDFRPKAIIDFLDLRKPIYYQTA
ncbi:MAG: methionine adenosyltransferase, partial [Elusimicrobiales bacterium]|nr:methionine adenosyltransferase [Elusimicrobiales bacterium]